MGEAVEELTPVCGQGAECRDNVMIEVTDALRNEWELTLQNIAKAIENTFLIADDIMKKALEDMLACDAGCKCDDILTEYREILNLQDKIQDEIDELGTALGLLHGERENMLQQCPEYETIEVGEWAFGTVETKETKEEVVLNEGTMGGATGSPATGDFVFNEEIVLEDTGFVMEDQTVTVLDYNQEEPVMLGADEATWAPVEEPMMMADPMMMDFEMATMEDEAWV